MGISSSQNLTYAQQVEQMQENWRKNDPDYAVIISYMHAQMEEIGREFPAHMWPQILELQYKLLKAVFKDLSATVH